MTILLLIGSPLISIGLKSCANSIEPDLMSVIGSIILKEPWTALDLVLSDESL